MKSRYNATAFPWIDVEEPQQLTEREVRRGLVEAGRSAVAAPTPFRRVVAHAGADRIENDVTTGFAEMLVGEDLDAPKAFAK